MKICLNRTDISLYKRLKGFRKRIERAFYWRYGRLYFRWNGIKYGKNLICNGNLLIDIEKMRQ